MSIYGASINSLILGDLYALQQHLYESGVGSGRFYFKLEEGSFQRPSIFIKLVGSNVTPYHMSFREIKSEIMVQYFTEDYYDAQVVANDLQFALSGGPLFADLVLPRYDFTTSPPTKRTVSGWDNDGIHTAGGQAGHGVLGARIDPSTISNGGIVQEDNRAWNTAITFSMDHPLLSFQDFPTIENVTFEILTGEPVLPQIRKVCTRGVPSVEITDPC